MAATPTTKTIAEVSRKIFGNLPILHHRSGNKVLRRKLKGPTVASWFQKPVAMKARRGNPYNLEMHEERLEQLDKLKRRGKGPPRKGEGKRAAKKK